MTRILVVDDELGLRATLAANLEIEGFEVFEAETGERALELASKRDFDLVVTDIRMPGMSGVELFGRLRKLGKSMPVVLMTAFADEALIQGALEDGAFTVLSKPFDVAHALRLMTNAANRPLVLVVDDETSVAESTSQALEAVGLRARAVFSASEALAAVASGQTDVCVLDLVLPDVSGPELAVSLRNAVPGISIIAVSGHEVPEMIRRMAATGMHTFLRKPFAIRDLVRSIADARGKPSRRADSR